MYGIKKAYTNHYKKTMKNLATIRIGDKVTLSPDCLEGMNNDGVVYEVLSDPVEICGTWCVRLDKRSSYFDIGFLEKVE